MDKFSEIHNKINPLYIKLYETCSYNTLNNKIDTHDVWMQRSDKNGILTYNKKSSKSYYKILNVMRDKFPKTTDKRRKKDIENLLFRTFKDKKQNNAKILNDSSSEY